MQTDDIIWLIVFDSTLCRIFKYGKKHKQLQLLKELNHPENKLRDIDLTSDKPGRYQSGHSAHGAYNQATDPKEIKIDNFMREIANELEQGRNIHAYAKLIIIAAPHVNGIFLKHASKHVKKLIIKTIEKDFIFKTDRELLESLSI